MTSVYSPTQVEARQSAAQPPLPFQPAITFSNLLIEAAPGAVCIQMIIAKSSLNLAALVKVSAPIPPLQLLTLTSAKSAATEESPV